MNGLNNCRQDFPILEQNINGQKLVYFDNAATTQKPQVFIEKLVEYYSKYNANVNRGVHHLSQKATELYEDTREYIANTYNCKKEEVIFTKNDTESLNIIANGLSKLWQVEKKNGKTNILRSTNPQDVEDDLENINIVLTDLEHHSSIIPWQAALGQLTGRDVSINQNQVRYLPFNDIGEIDIEHLDKYIDSHTTVLSVNWTSNTFGLINNLQEIVFKSRQINPNLIIIVDCAQTVPHMQINFGNLSKEFQVDFITFSAHKLCGSTGVGVLIGRKELLEQMPPLQYGGDMIKEVDFYKTSFNDLPYKLEAGTPNIAGVVAFKSSLEYLNSLGFNNILRYEQDLASYMLDELQKLDFVTIYGYKDLKNYSSNTMQNPPNTVNSKSDIEQSLNKIKQKIALISFNIEGVHPHDAGTIFDEYGIAVRTGHHCTQLVMRKLQIPATIRASLYIYNTQEEIDKFVDAVIEIYNVFRY